MANYDDLVTQNKSQDGKYIDLVLPDLDPDTIYNFTFAWQYEDPNLGENGFSPESDVFKITTVEEPELLPPYFIADNLSAKNSLLYITWNGKTNILTDYTDNKLKQVNIWIKGGDFGEEFVKYGPSFTKASTIQIATVQKATYCVKLQAESNNGQTSAFSPEFCVTLLKQPKAVTNLSSEWISDDLELTFDFDSTLVDATNDNTKVDMFIITISANSRTHTVYHPINKSVTKQTYVLDRETNVSEFKLFATQLMVLVQARDIYDQVSTVVEHTSVTYETPLDTPIISVTKSQLSYYVSYNSQSGKPFDSIYIFEDTGSGYSQVAQGTSNPILVRAGNTLTRSVKALFYDINSIATGYSNIVTVTPDPLVSFTDEAPNPPTSFSGVGGLDNSGSIGFNGFINFTWTPHSSSSNIRGYRIRFRPFKSAAPLEEWSYVDSPGNATTYRLTGLAVGTTYEIAVGSFNEFNKESITYTSGTNVTVSGTPFIAEEVNVTGYFSANSGTETGEFRFGYGIEQGKRGIRFNDDNYWYIDSNASAAFKLGGDAENYIQWNGQAFIVQGDLRAKKGNFSGNVEIKSGGSLWSAIGGMNANQSDIVGAGYVLNSSGLKFNSESVSDITTISGSTGRFVTKSAEIGGWDVDSSTISKNGISLKSSGEIIANKNAYYIGIKPSSTVNDIVLWAGQSSTGGTTSSGPNFRVTSDGVLYASGAKISGDITLTTGSGLDTIISGKANVFRQTEMPTGGSYKSGDLWIDTNDLNKVYAWNTDVVPNTWTVIQNSAEALAKATAAENLADDAADRARKFDSSTGNLIDALILSEKTASIYSPSAKSTYGSVATGYFLGWYNYSGASWAPAINIGGANTYLKYNTYDDKLEVRGKIEATEGSFAGVVTAGGGQISIGPSGISTLSNKFSIDAAGNASFSGTLQAGTVLSEGQISGGTITGSVFKTSSGSKNIEIKQSGDFGQILFNSINPNDNIAMTGYISSDAPSYTGRLYIRAPQKNASPNESSILMWNFDGIPNITLTSSNGTANIVTGTLYIETNAGNAGSTSGVVFRGRAPSIQSDVNNGWGIWSLRNIRAGTSAPPSVSDLIGSIWIQYAS